MAVHVDSLISEVIPEPEPPAEGNVESTKWEELDQLRGTYARITRDQRRTAAEGFND